MKLPSLTAVVHSKLNTLSSVSNIKSILSKLSLMDQIDLCIHFQISVPGVWPVLFQKPGKLPDSVSTLFMKDPMSNILKYLKTKTQIILPKHIVIHDNETGRVLYFGEQFTAPTENMLKRHFLFGAELDNIYVLSCRQYQFEEIEDEREICVEIADASEVENVEQTCLEIPDASPERNLNSPHNIQYIIEQEHEEEMEIHQLRLQNTTVEIEDQNICIDHSTSDVDGAGVDDFKVDEGHGQSITADNVRSFENVSQEPEFDSGPSEPYFPSNANSNTTFGTVPKTDQRNMNIFLHPEKASCEEINSLIHISKRQFLEFVHLISFPIHKHILLSKYSQAFMFRLKLASNWSFDELGTVFCTGNILEYFEYILLYLSLYS